MCDTCIQFVGTYVLNHVDNIYFVVFLSYLFYFARFFLEYLLIGLCLERRITIVKEEVWLHLLDFFFLCDLIFMNRIRRTIEKLKSFLFHYHFFYYSVSETTNLPFWTNSLLFQEYEPFWFVSPCVNLMDVSACLLVSPNPCFMLKKEKNNNISLFL